MSDIKEIMLKIKYFALLSHLLQQTHTHIITSDRKLALKHQPDLFKEELAEFVSLIQSVDGKEKVDTFMKISQTSYLRRGKEYIFNGLYSNDK